MKKVIGWWFGTTDRKLLNKDGRKIVIGKTHKVRGEIIPCKHGLHLSKRVIDALIYAPGPVIYRVVGSGVVVPHGNPIDKYACSERTYIAGGSDISDVLRLFAKKCALDVIHLWNPPDIVVKYLKIGDETNRAAAQAAAQGATWDVTRASSRDAAWGAARIAACEAAWEAAWAGACEAVQDAAWEPAWEAARETIRNKQNSRLTAMISKLLYKNIGAGDKDVLTSDPTVRGRKQPRSPGGKPDKIRGGHM